MSGIFMLGLRACVAVGRNASNASRILCQGNSNRVPRMALQSVSQFHTCMKTFNEKRSSLFGDLTDSEEASKLSALAKHANSIGLDTQEETDTEVLSKAEEDEKKLIHAKETIFPENDNILKDHLKEVFKPLIAVDELLSPLKKQVYLANVAQNGFFKNGETVKLENGEQYKLTLKKEEIEVLEPSLYLKSYRLKSSTKKVTLVTRLLNQLPLKEAINQCHFSTKKVAKSVGELLEEALEKAKEVNLDTKKLYIAQIWSGNDGQIMKRMEFKGRGRVGLITHRYAHVRVVLKSEQTKKRLAYEQAVKKAKQKPWEQLPSEVIRGVAPGFYKW